MTNKETREEIAADLNNVLSALSMAEPGWDSYSGIGDWNMRSIADAINSLANAVARLADLEVFKEPGYGRRFHLPENPPKTHEEEQAEREEERRKEEEEADEGMYARIFGTKVAPAAPKKRPKKRK